MASDGLELIRRIAGGDRDAFSAFYDAYAPLALGVLCRILRSDAEAEAVLLDVFWEIWQSAGDWDPRQGSLEAWVVDRARSRGIDRARSLRGRGEVGTGPLPQLRVAEPLEPGRDPRVGAEGPGAVRGAFAQLPPHQRDIIELAYLHDLTQAETSERLKQPLGAVKAGMRLGLESLRSQPRVQTVRPDHAPFGELAAAHALRSLGRDDLARFQAHLAGCAECEQLLGDYREALVGFAADFRQPPPRRAKRDVMARVDRRGARGARERFWSGLRWAASVAVAAGLLASAAATYVSGRYEGRLGQMAREVAALRGQVGQQRLALALLRDPATQVVLLEGLEPSPQARGRLIWNAHAGGLFVAADLPPAPAGRAYELWAIVGTRPLPSGVFGVDAEGTGSLRVPPLAAARRVNRFAVTLELAQGVPAPTGQMYLASK
ncbi:MAG: hypothetical protein DME09_05500 [Candidatus Rokuibacteriota bacterium]|nr:MAG: hypothetical protein DME09_05500 [Candidatus Rokubacteria bacterium]